MEEAFAKSAGREGGDMGDHSMGRLLRDHSSEAGRGAEICMQITYSK